MVSHDATRRHDADPTRHPRRFSLTDGSRWRRIALALALAVVVAGVTALIPPRTRAAGTFVGVKTYYLALGDSLAFGYEPNLDWSHGYAQKWNTDLQQHGSKSFTNYGCNGETSATFINGGCPFAFALHNFYAGAQLNAAVNFLKAHPGQVSPVSLDIGANDLLPDINSSTCAISSTWATDLANLDARLTGTILPKLAAALTVNGARSGDLVMMNYYDPFQNQCASNPQVLANLQTLNQHIAQDAAQFSVPVADVFTAFGGTTTPNPNICSYTWMCASQHDIHATGGQSGEPGNGYGVIAGAFESLSGY